MVYSSNEIDGFMTCYEEIYYLIPCRGVQTQTIWLEKSSYNTQGLFAEDYLFEKIILTL